jgi:serine protease AprX
VTQRFGRFSAGLVVLLLAAPIAAVGSSGAPVGVIVRAGSAAEAERAIEMVGGTVTFPLPIVNGAAGTVASDAVDDVAARPGVIDVARDLPVAFQSGGENNRWWRTDADGPRQSVFAREVEANRLWDQVVTGQGVRVALIDTGVSPVPDLADRLVQVPSQTDPSKTAACIDFSGELNCNDSYGHGTFVAGLIAGTGASSNGTHKGVAPGAEIVSIKIAGRDGSADVSKVLAAIQWVVSFREQLNIRVLNLSLGTNSPFSYRHDPLNFAVERAWRSGITVVVSASNLGPAPGTIAKPADDPLVITTGALNDRGTSIIWDDYVPNFSGRGPTRGDGLSKPDVVAPGAHVVSLRSPGSYVEQAAPGGGVDSNYRRASGTSMSAGIVSGAAALTLSANPTWTPDRVKFALMETARRVGSSDPQVVGRGIISAYRAAREAPNGLANTDVFVLSDGTGSLDQSRGDVKVTTICTDPIEKAATPRRCDVVQGAETAQGRMFDAEEYRETDWTGSSWYQSQWNFILGSSWYGSSWYGSSWYGSSWYGSSWYGYQENNEAYGVSLLGSSWYGAWE